jgi:2-dehydropantoate 2-reductase
MTVMRVLVAGAGALGTCYAALLAAAGAEVSVLARPARHDALRRGLRVSGLLEAEAQVAVVSRGQVAEGGAGAQDYVIVATKTQDTASILEALEGVQTGAVLSLQNGVAKDELLAGAFGAQRVLGAACAVGATLLEPGHARLTLNQGTWVGERFRPDSTPDGAPSGVPDAGASERVVRLVAVLRGAGFPSWSVPDIRAVEWYKLCALLPGAMVTTLSRRSYAEMALHPHLARLFVQVMRETFGVMQAQGMAVQDPPGSLWRFAEWLPAPDEVSLEGLRDIGERQRAAGERMLPSMLQDVLAGRLTEVEHLAGEVLRQAAALDLRLPATETCYRLIRGLEDAFPPPTGEKR